jgi:prepilin-type N-terminal cleavage/methylation domain-containing protein
MIKSGQTLIELLVAMTVISVGLLATITLVYGNRMLVERDTDEVVALNIAREGIELAKNLRDSNWLANLPFTTGFVGPNGAPAADYTAVPVWDGLASVPSFDFTPDAFTHPATIVLRSTNPATLGFFANSSTLAAVTGSTTPFRRLLTFHPLCAGLPDAPLASGAACSDTGLETVGIRVESRVEWNRAGKAFNVTLYSDLYDWR